MDVWIPAAGIVGLIVPIPSLVWTWRRWASNSCARQDHGLRYCATIVSMGAVSLAVVGWATDVACFYKHRVMPFALCNAGWEKAFTSLFGFVTIVAASLGTKRSRWTTILCGSAIILYMLSLGASVE